MGLLAISYFLFGNYFFYKNDYNKLIRITAGFTLSMLIITLLYSFNLSISTYSKLITTIGFIYSFTLFVFWLKKRDSFPNELKIILFRLSSLSIITSFFVFSSIQNDIYRYIIKNLTDHESYLYFNIKMFDEVSKYEDNIANNNYDTAIQAAKSAITYGKKWKNYEKNEYQYFSGTYDMLYKSYTKKAQHLYDNKKYNEALKNYFLVDSIFNLKEYKTDFLKKKKTNQYWNRFDILKSYNKINDFTSYDIEINYIIENYSKHNDSISIDYYYILENMIDNYSKRDFHKDVIELNKTSFKILRKDSLNNISYYKSRYLSLVKTYLVTDSIDNSKKYLKKYLKISKEKDCTYLLYNSLINEKSNINLALISAKKCYDCFSKKEKLNILNTFYSSLLLSRLYLANSNYSDFSKQLKVTKKWLLKNKDYKLNLPYTTLLESNYNDIIGNYHNAKQLYSKTKKEFKNIETKGDELFFIDLKIALLNNELNIDFNRRDINKEGINYISSFDYMFPSNTDIYNDIANLNINFKQTLADSLFSITLDIHKKYNIKNSPNIGIALNGLGLIEFNNKNYTKADSLFTKSIKTFDNYYPENNNFNQIISYLNISESKLKQKKTSLSSFYLKKAIQVNNNSFGKKQSVYNFYITVLNADIYFENKKKTLAIKEYEKALILGKKYYSKDHPLILDLTKKIDNLNFNKLK
ncbi:tetratricopeptide repeat protein [Tenacibaculum sp. S7007]|uniref:Tetratricopeptide repeat protein n=1 Tax=Tenacibaculum pelagium TaxID=2759527 RepID=A0A839AJN9_9FLAO|nr:tetratricopeptide repeat protein [Tenacibaculum pelagium]MBA6155323.1 tetratricopeptide repeat protein [Tenacibaculum pelagium]